MWGSLIDQFYTYFPFALNLFCPKMCNFDEILVLIGLKCWYRWFILLTEYFGWLWSNSEQNRTKLLKIPNFMFIHTWVHTYVLGYVCFWISRKEQHIRVHETRPCAAKEVWYTLVFAVTCPCYTHTWPCCWLCLVLRICSKVYFGTWVLT